MHTLLSRASTGELFDPGPSEQQIGTMLEAAVRAPDHGKLRPWRFFVIRGDARFKLSDLFVKALGRREPGASEAQIAKERGKPLRSPVTITVVAHIEPDHKVPEIEQVLSAGAAAMNILNAAHALGFGAKWVTGANCYDPAFLAEFGLTPDEHHLGFIHIGSRAALPEPVRPDPNDFTTNWTGEPR